MSSFLLEQDTSYYGAGLLHSRWTGQRFCKGPDWICLDVFMLDRNFGGSQVKQSLETNNEWKTCSKKLKS